jgi:hypothetical protein
MEHLQAQPAAHSAHRLCRGMGHIHADIPAGRGQRSHQRPDGTEREVYHQLDGGDARLHIEGVQWPEGGTGNNPQRQRPGDYRRQLYPACRPRGRRAEPVWCHRSLRRELCGDPEFRRHLPHPREHQQDRDAGWQVYQRARLQRAPQGGGALTQSGQGALS